MEERSNVAALGWFGALCEGLGVFPGSGRWRLSVLALSYSALFIWVLIEWIGSWGEDGLSLTEVGFWVLEVSYPVLTVAANWASLAPAARRRDLRRVTRLLGHGGGPRLLPRLLVASLLVRTLRFSTLLLRLRISVLLMVLAQMLSFMLVLYQFLGFLLLLSSRLRSLSLLPSCYSLRLALRLHSSLLRAADSLTRLYTPQILVAALIVFHKSVFFSYQLVILLSMTPRRPLLLLDTCSALLFWSLQIFFLFSACDHASAQNERFHRSIFRYACTLEATEKRKIYLHLLAPRKMKFSVKGLFTMKVRNLMPVLATITTLVILLFQYKFDVVGDI